MLPTITSNRIFANIQKCRTHHQVLLFGECSSSPGHVFLLCSPLLFQWWRVLRAMAIVNGQPLTRLPIHRWAWHLGGANHVELVMKRTVNHRCDDMYIEQTMRCMVAINLGVWRNIQRSNSSRITKSPLIFPNEFFRFTRETTRAIDIVIHRPNTTKIQLSMAQHTHRTEHMASTMAASGEPGGRSRGGGERQWQRQVGAAEVRAAAGLSIL